MLCRADILCSTSESNNYVGKIVIVRGNRGGKNCQLDGFISASFVSEGCHPVNILDHFNNQTSFARYYTGFRARVQPHPFPLYVQYIIKNMGLQEKDLL